MKKPRITASIFVMGLMVWGANVAFGQSYPNKPIRFVAVGVGSGSDFVARLVGQGISGPLGQPIVVDNRPTGVIQAEIVSRAPPDGYTLLVNGSTFWILPLLQNAPWDVARDFSPITLTDRSPSIVVVNPSVPVKSIKELIALAKARPGALNYGSGASGSPPHLAAELFKSMAGVDVVRVSYKTFGAPTVNDLIAGDLQMAIPGPNLVVPHIKAGRLRALAVTTAQPSALFPDLPTVAASGLPGYEHLQMTAIYAPAKTPDAIIRRLNQEIVRVLNRDDVKEKFLVMGTEVVGSSPEQAAAAVRADAARLGKVIKDAGITAD